MRKLTFLTAALLLGLLLVLTGWRVNAAREARTAPAPALQASAITPGTAIPSRVAVTPVAFSPEDAAFLQGLRQRFAALLHQQHARIRAIEQLINYLKAHYPDDWRERVAAFLSALSPELATELQAAFEALMRYDDWLREQRERLASLPAAQRREELWQKRRELFGEAAAADIWAAERRGEQLQSTLAALDRSDGRALDEKLDDYLAAIDRAYGRDAPMLLDQRRTELMNRFLSLDAVQTQLASLTPTERSATLRDLRARMGLDSAALDRWSGLDRDRDHAWERGQRYLQERQQILARYQGSEQQQRLHALQDQLLGPDADTIRDEESAGFFRYAHARRYGRE